MSLFRCKKLPRISRPGMSYLVFALGLALRLTSSQAQTSPSVILWDTGKPLGADADINERQSWKPVPIDLFTLEADPSKASSDPGYYGREYAFKGDAVVENSKFFAAFWSTKGRVAIYTKAAGGISDTNSASPQKLLELLPRSEE